MAFYAFTTPGDALLGELKIGHTDGAHSKELFEAQRDLFHRYGTSHPKMVLLLFYPHLKSMALERHVKDLFSKQFVKTVTGENSEWLQVELDVLLRAVTDWAKSPAASSSDSPTCVAVLKKGDRKEELCGKKSVNGGSYCSVHRDKTIVPSGSAVATKAIPAGTQTATLVIDNATHTSQIDHSAPVAQQPKISPQAPVERPSTPVQVIVQTAPKLPESPMTPPSELVDATSKVQPKNVEAVSTIPRPVSTEPIAPRVPVNSAPMATLKLTSSRHVTINITPELLRRMSCDKPNGFSPLPYPNFHIELSRGYIVEKKDDYFILHSILQDSVVTSFTRAQQRDASGLGIKDTSTLDTFLCEDYPFDPNENHCRGPSRKFEVHYLLQALLVSFHKTPTQDGLLMIARNIHRCSNPEDFWNPVILHIHGLTIKDKLQQDTVLREFSNHIPVLEYDPSFQYSNLSYKQMWNTYSGAGLKEIIVRLGEVPYGRVKDDDTYTIFHIGYKKGCKITPWYRTLKEKAKELGIELYRARFIEIDTSDGAHELQRH